MIVREEPPPTTRDVRPRERLAVRVWLGIGMLFGVLALAVGLCIGALLNVYDALKHISELSAAERHAVAIGVAAREQYMHQSHGVILRDPKHLGHDRHWAAMLTTHVESLRPMVGAEERRRLDGIEAESTALSKVFGEEILPAAVAADDVRLRAAHVSAEKRVEAMIRAADASIAQLSIRTKSASALATAHARRVCSVAAITTGIAALIAIGLAVGLARQIIRPVNALNAAAARIGQGDFEARAPRVGTWEFDQLREGLRQMAERLRERETRLLHAERLATIGALAAGIAHELNNPLGVMLGYLKRLRRESLPGQPSQELRIVEEEAQQCHRIVDDLVMLAREPKLELSSLDLAALVPDICERLAALPDIDGRPIRVQAPEPVRVDADATRIAQVVRNLISNAAAASSPSEPIEVEVGRVGEEAEIVVRDHGAGIEPEDLPRVFEPFYSRRSGGTGLGLAVSHGIVRSHGGTIAIESTRGSGTSVIVRLPLRIPAKGATT